MQRWELGGMGGCGEDAEMGARRYGRMQRWELGGRGGCGEDAEMGARLLH